MIVNELPLHLQKWAKEIQMYNATFWWDYDLNFLTYNLFIKNSNGKDMLVERFDYEKDIPSLKVNAERIIKEFAG